MKPFVEYDEAGKRTIFACAHWRSFPPAYSNTEMSPEELRKQGLITEPDYQRFRVWQRTCGLIEMLPEKCKSCPLIRIAEVKKGLPVLTTLDGSLSVPAVDLPTLELKPKSRQTRFRSPQGQAGKVPGGKVS